MSDSNLVLLLQLVSAGAEVDALLARGLEFSQIAMLINEAFQGGLIIESEDSLRLTEAGIEKMRVGPKDQRARRDGGWISPREEFRIEKSGLDEIYLPGEETALSLGRVTSLYVGNHRNGESPF